jgi:hypothetical protein
MFTIYPARLILAPQPERAACPAVEPLVRGAFSSLSWEWLSGRPFRLLACAAPLPHGVAIDSTAL